MEDNVITVREILHRKTVRWPAIVGVLIVVFVFGYIVTKQPVSEDKQHLPEIAELTQVTWEYAVYRDYFVALAKEKGAMYAFAVLREAPIPAGVDIHRLAHFIGFEYYEEVGLDGMAGCPQDFRNACSHAVVTEAFIEKGSVALKDIAQACTEAPGGATAYALCFHGVGHGILAYLDYDFEEAVNQCRQVYDFVAATDPKAEESAIWYECIGGATMELSQGDHNPSSKERIKKMYYPDSDILMPCSAPYMPDGPRPACYAYITGRFLTAAGAKRGLPSPEAYPEALAYCEQIPKEDARDRRGCYGGFGVDFIFFASGDARRLERMSEEALASVHEWCMMAPNNDGRQACTVGALDTVFWGGQSMSDGALTFCRITPDPGIRNACYKSLVSSARYVYMDSPDKLAEVCAEVPEALREECLGS